MWNVVRGPKGDVVVAAAAAFVRVGVGKLAPSWLPRSRQEWAVSSEQSGHPRFLKVSVEVKGRAVHCRCYDSAAMIVIISRISRVCDAPSAGVRWRTKRGRQDDEV